MATEIKVPTLGESVTSATVARWMKHEGDAVAADEPLVELETDKVTVEVNAPVAGVLTSIAVPEGGEVEVGALLALLEAGGTAAVPSAAPPPRPAATPAPPRAADLLPLALSEGAEGSNPVPQPQPSRGGGVTVAAAAVVAEREPVPAGRAAANPPAGVNPPPRPIGPVSRPAGAAAPPQPLPAAAKLMEEQHVAPEQVGEGSGKDGRITKGDVLAFLNRPAPAPAAPPAARPPRVEEPREQRVRMTRLRRTIAARLKEAQNTAAMLTTFNEVDMSAVMALRSTYREAFEKKHAGTRLGFMSSFVRACCVALKEFPAVNAEIDGDDIVYKNFVHMGIAVGGPAGLVVPVVRDADAMSFVEIERAIADFGKRVREGALKLEELAGGTFSITNGGVYGSLMSTPILNPPQSAILGMHKIQERPIAVAGKVEIRPMMYLALSYDHRIVDGSEAVSFLVRVKEGIEDPRRLLLGV
jgi:2-oxoglutarate dehydrogenase E2 component (dihydrolipoamide succinyltransferase)